MAIGDKVRIGFGSGVEVNYEGNVAVYDLKRNHHGAVEFDAVGNVTPILIGGVRSGTTGTIKDVSVKADKRFLKGLQESSTSLGTSDMQLVPISCDAYGDRVAWVAAEHIRIIG